jgi:hypothetical protein
LGLILPLKISEKIKEDHLDEIGKTFREASIELKASLGNRRW